MELLVDAADRSAISVVTRWSDRAALEAQEGGSDGLARRLLDDAAEPVGVEVAEAVALDAAGDDRLEHQIVERTRSLADQLDARAVVEAELRRSNEDLEQF